MNNLKGRIALVTGASKGIGASIAKHIAAAGATVYVNYASSKQGADETVAAIAKDGGQATAIQGDFSLPEDIARVFAAISAAEGRLDILVNNAGVYTFSALEEIDATLFYKHFNLNVLGLLLATQQATRLMGPAGGSIINISSLSATMAPARSTVYSASKGAVNSITVALSKELGSRRIRVNSLSPGAVETEGTAKFSAAFQAMTQVTPLGRIGTSPDIAKVAVFLASDDSSWITGQDIRVDGGMTM